MSQTPADDPVEPRQAQWKLWHVFAAIGVLSALFALMISLDMSAAISVTVVGLTLLAIQGLLLTFVMRWLRRSLADSNPQANEDAPRR